MTWTKLVHRNLYFPTDALCPCCQKETLNQIHLIRCPVIRTYHWEPMCELMRKFGWRTPGTHSDLNWEAFLITGKIGVTGIMGKGQADIMFTAYRTIYAELSKAIHTNHTYRLTQPTKRMAQMVITSLTAYGERWLKWYPGQRYQERSKKIPIRYRKQTLITTEEQGRYKISEHLYEHVKKYGG